MKTPLPLVMLSALSLIYVASVGAAQWNKKPYTEWSEKESMKVLNDSPWAQTQTITDTSQMTGQGRADSALDPESRATLARIRKEHAAGLAR